MRSPPARCRCWPARRWPPTHTSSSSSATADTELRAARALLYESAELAWKTVTTGGELRRTAGPDPRRWGLGHHPLGRGRGYRLPVRRRQLDLRRLPAATAAARRPRRDPALRGQTGHADHRRRRARRPGRHGARVLSHGDRATRSRTGAGWFSRCGPAPGPRRRRRRARRRPGRRHGGGRVRASSWRGRRPAAASESVSRKCAITAASASTGVSGAGGRAGRRDTIFELAHVAPSNPRRIVAGVTARPRRRAGSGRVRAAIGARPVQLIRGRGVCRWSTASWWRRTRISISLLVSDRVRSTIQTRSWRTSGRSAAAPPADHAWLSAADERAGHGLCAQFGHPHGGPSRRPTWPRVESWACGASLRFDGRFYHRTPGGATITRSMQGRQCGRAEIRIDRSKTLVEEPGTGTTAGTPTSRRCSAASRATRSILETRDAFDGQFGPGRHPGRRSPRRTWTCVHPLTGPVYVDGAEPGDLLEVEILDVEPDRYGYTVQVPGFGFLRDVFPDPFKVNWDIADGWATSADLPGVRIPGAPFMGTIGLSPGHELLGTTTAREQALLDRGGFVLPPSAGVRGAGRPAHRRARRCARSRPANRPATSTSSSLARAPGCSSRSTPRARCSPPATPTSRRATARPAAPPSR